MNSMRHFVYVFALIMCICLCACESIGIESPAYTPTLMPVIPVNLPGVVNADTVPVRRGPGAEFELAALINLGYSINIIGQSEDNKWYMVDIPGFSDDQRDLWIAADFVTLASSSETATMTPVEVTPLSPSTETATTTIETAVTEDSLPSPIATLLISTFQSPTSACGAPTGWIIYIVQPGDTLLWLATKTNTSVEQIKVANCLTNNQVIVGTWLYLPFLPPTDTLLPPDTLVPSTTATLFPMATLTPSSTLVLIQTPSSTPTGTATQRPIETITFTNTVIVSPAVPTQGITVP